MEDANATSVIWRRDIYKLTPQMDIYEAIRHIAHGKQILEIGFGTGFGILQYFEVAQHVDAVEIDSDAIGFARRVMPLRNVRWIEDDWLNPTRNYRGYDLIIIIEVLEHLASPRKALMALRKAMRKNGTAIITVPNTNRYRRRREALNLHEWKPHEFQMLLSMHFGGNVFMLDSDLMPAEEESTRRSPLIAGVRRAS